MTKYILLLLGFTGILSSCSPRLKPFTQELNNSYDWTESDLKQIQFYISSDIILYREIGSETSQIVDGGIRIKDGQKVEEIIFKKGTPGVLLFSPKSDRFAISFDDVEGTDRYLMFGPSENARGNFVLLAKKWRQNQGTISYNNDIYYTDAKSAYAILLVDIKKAKKVKFNSKKIKGRKISQ
ncbi:MAG: hypothetical protein IMY67_09265 [Bacteroidetes bacterium]|nr:hypothetical protein [Bacteroidota bacterium]